MALLLGISLTLGTIAYGLIIIDALRSCRVVMSQSPRCGVEYFLQITIIIFLGIFFFASCLSTVTFLLVHNRPIGLLELCMSLAFTITMVIMYILYRIVIWRDGRKTDGK